MNTHTPSFCLLVGILFTHSALAFPAPCPKPAHTYEEAAKMVMKDFRARTKEMTPQWRDTAFPQSISFSNFNYHPQLRDWIPEDDQELLKDSDQSWLLEEWGWLVKVVMAHDL
ncbi:MAG: hypothetical protein AAGA96_01340 [Verrucomicrobiota bacterium]